MLKYSVVIPVYNCEKYIKDAVDSILYKKENFEIILVDDGSTDNSGKICDSYADKYDNVFVYHIANNGAGNARNIGINNASGDFIIFLDADDLISKDFFDNISYLEEQSHCDVIFFQTVKLFESGAWEPMNEGFTYENITCKSKKEVLKNITTFNKFPASCAGKIINREFIIENKIAFPVGKLGEDIDLTLNLLIKGNKFGYYDKGSYIYRKSKKSRSSKGNRKSVEDLLFIIQNWVSISEDSAYKQYILSYLSYEYAMIFPFLGYLNKQDRKCFLKQMHKLKYLLHYGKTKKIKAIKFCVHMLGIEKTALLLNYYVNKRDNR